MEKPKSNKSLESEEKKEPPSAEAAFPQMDVHNLGEEKTGVKIKFRPNRSAEGVEVDVNGEATVSVEFARYLVSIGYADYVD